MLVLRDIELCRWRRRAVCRDNALKTVARSLASEV